MNYVWLLCLKWDYWKLHFFVSMVFPFSGLETRSSLQKTTTPHQHNAKKLQDEAEAHQELLHFQNAYPSDPRAFFSTRRARQVGTSVLQRLRTKFPSREREWVMWVASVYCTGVQKRVRKKKVWIGFHVVNVVGCFFFEFWKYTGLPRQETKKSERIVVPSHGNFPGALGWCDHLSSWQENGRSEPTQVERLSDFLAFTRFPTTWSWDSCSGSVEIGWKWNENCLFLSSMLQSCWLMSKVDW